MLKLMIVDDEEAILNGLQHMVRLERTLFTDIACASDGFAALELMDRFRPDLLITDIQMPAMDGLELIREAKLKGVSNAIILTGFDAFEYARDALRLQVADYLLKPIDRNELAAILRKSALSIIEERKRNGVTAQLVGHSQEAIGGAKDPNVTIIKFQEFIRNHYMRDISLEEVAEHLFLHPNYVCNVLKKETGMTFIQYLHQIRLEKAKELLSLNPSLPMEQVAVSVGYSNPRHFYKVFKQYVGQTPGSFRES
jgi:two-component system response regulator YesN